MIRLTDIEQRGNVISCAIYPEDSIKSGSLVYDRASKEIKDYSLPQGYEYCRNHVFHACRYFDSIPADEMPESKTIV